MTGEVTQDSFLGGRLTIAQPKRGFRAGHDSVLLAAAIPARCGDSVLEFGSGVGVVSLCLAARVPDCCLLGIERDPALVALAQNNAEANGMAARVRFAVGDVRSFETRERFDHIFFNPPFHPASGQISPDVQRDAAMRDVEDAPLRWVLRAGDCLAEGGTITLILRADRLDMLRGGLGGAVRVLPLAPRAGEPPKRAIVQIRPWPAGFEVLAPFILHEADGRPSQAAEAVLRHGAPLPME
jgi:tRNA1(Val) A37 N6-methylase TrmN6